MDQYQIQSSHKSEMDSSLCDIEPTFTALTPLSTPLTDYLPVSAALPGDYPTLPSFNPYLQQAYQPNLHLLQPQSQVYNDKHHYDLQPHLPDLENSKPKAIYSPPVVDSGVSSGSESGDSSPRSSPVPKVMSIKGQGQGTKPEESYIYLISQAILNSQDKRLVLADIYKYILDNYPYYESVKTGWKNCVRHNLSVNECFVRTKRGSGSRGWLWAIHPVCLTSVQQGVHCRRTLNQMVFNHKKAITSPQQPHSPVQCSFNPSPNGTPSSSCGSSQSLHLRQPYSSQQVEPIAPMSAYVPMTSTVVRLGDLPSIKTKGRTTKKQRYLAAHAQCVQVLGY